MTPNFGKHGKHHRHDEENLTGGKLFKVLRRHETKDGNVVAAIAIDKRKILQPEVVDLARELIAQNISSKLSTYVTKHHAIPNGFEQVDECMNGIHEQSKKELRDAVISAANDLMDGLYHSSHFMSSAVHRAMEIVDGNIEGD